MLYREIIAVCSQIHTKHINTLCGQNVELWLLNHWALEGSFQEDFKDNADKLCSSLIPKMKEIQTQAYL
jgi:hypothetical protein